MTIFKFERPQRWQDDDSSFFPTKRHGGGKIQVSVAESLSDFMQATPLLRRVAMETCAPIDPNRIGELLARMNHGGSGPKTGCIILARIDGSAVGFAVLLTKPEGEVELAWLHAGDTDPELVAEKLWEKVWQIKTEWQVPVVHVGAFSPMPEAMLASVSAI